jgi:leucyl aminopeptidase
MEIRIQAKPLEKVECDVLVVIAFERADAEALTGLPLTLNELTGGWVEDVYKSGEFAGKLFDVSVLHRPSGLKAKRIAVVGAGKSQAFSETIARKAAAFAVRNFKANSGVVAIAVEPVFVASSITEGVITGSWEQDFHKSANRKENKITEVSLVVASESPELTASVDRGRIIGESQNFARDIINEPGNVLPPREFVRRARQMAEESGLEVDILDQDRMKQLGMGSLLGVAVGSAEPPFLMVLRYKPESPSTADHLGLVGKGVTFDTGGISIKPSDGMEKMKNDMAGGGAMLGAMRAIARLKPSIAVTAFIPTVENMPGSRAQRPGDIVKSMAGKTIEVLNTDAEGRLILIDAITYAKQQGCTHLIDAATLTGAIGVALGNVHAGAFTNNDAMLQRVLTAAKKAGENLWHMPTDDDYREQLKSAYADLANIGGRAGGACTAAVFIKDWVEDTPWVHLDIALTAYLDDSKPFIAKGATGFGVRTFVNVALGW